MKNLKPLYAIIVVVALCVMVAMYGIRYGTHRTPSPMHQPAPSTQHGSSDMQSHHAHQHAEPKEAELIARIQTGGYILYVRHERTELSRTADEEPLHFADCSTQRNLSPAGRESAKEVADAMRLLQVPVSVSYSSPFCRSYDTAVLLFGETTRVTALAGRRVATDAFDMKIAGELTREFLLGLTIPKEQNIAVTGHWGTINAATGIHVHEGDMAVFSVEEGKLVHHGTIAPATWSDVIHDKERTRTMMSHSPTMHGEN